MKKRRRIAFVTGSRAEYGLLQPVMAAIRSDPRLELQLIVTGMHLVRRCGLTLREIVRDGWRIDARVPMQSGRDDRFEHARAASKGIAGIAKALNRLNSDVVVVLGDRVEALAGALAGMCTNRFVAHLHGGDVAVGYTDDAFRHAITKLAHFHFAATRDAARRIIRMGEDPRHVFVVGAPGLDGLAGRKPPRAGWLQKRFGLPHECNVALIIQHPVGRSPTAEQRVMENILAAVSDCDLSGIMLYPNTDPGYTGIVRVIRQTMQSRNADSWAAVPSLSREEFWKCLQSCRVLVGNSSCGIIEAHSAGTVAVNVGPRQAGRLRSGPFVLDCGEQRGAVARAIRRALAIRVSGHKKNAYGSGRTGRIIARILASAALSDKQRRKRIGY